MSVKDETITELLSEVAKLNKRCQILEEKYQRCAIAEQKLDKLAIEFSSMSSQLASTRKVMEDLMVENRIMRQQKNVNLRLQKLRNMVVQNGSSLVSVKAAKKAGNKAGNKNQGLNSAGGSTTKKSQSTCAEGRQQPEKSQSTLRVSTKANDRGNGKRKILNTESRGARVPEDKPLNQNQRSQKSVPIISDTRKKETEKFVRPNGPRRSSRTKHNGSVAVVDKSNSDSSTVTKEHTHHQSNDATSYPDSPRGEPKSKNSRISKPTNTDQNVVPDVEAIMKQFQAHACNMCSKSYLSKNGLRNHQLQSHSVTTTCARFQCSQCGKYYEGKGSLRDHFRYKHSGKYVHRASSACSYCGKKFVGKLKLEIHMGVHTGERPYPCKICDKAFVSMSHLKGHVKSITHIRNVNST